jgi:hypothetical protein
MTDKNIQKAQEIDLPPFDEDELTGNEIAMMSKLSGKDGEYGGYAGYFVWALRHGSKLTWAEVKELPWKLVKPVMAPESDDPKE